jgi:fermentation-respiration switch protein FrsA (DUF1100 family)
MDRVPRLFLLLALAATSSALAAPGDLLAYSRDQVLSMEDLATIRDENGLEVEIENGVRTYRIEYATLSVKGEEVMASGLVVVPQGPGHGPYPIVSYQHGTTLRRVAAPSTDRTNEEAIAVTTLFGSRNFVVAIPDGLGLGKSSHPYHPFMHAKSEATSAADMIRATITLCGKLTAGLTGELFLLGYSQGGHWTMALHRELDSNPIPEFRIVASAPMEGPFDLSGASMREALEHPTISSTVYSAYLFHAYMSVYGTIASSYSEAIRAPYADRIPTLFSGATTLVYAYRKLPKRPVDLFTEEYMQGLLSNPDHPFLAALAENDLYDWRPAPGEQVILVHSRADEVVPFSNAELAYARMREKGALVELNEIPGEYKHVAGFLPAMQIAVKKFHPFRTGGRSHGQLSLKAAR